jgi:hypothetical protein
MDLPLSVILSSNTSTFMSDDERATDRWQNEGGKIKAGGISNEGRFYTFAEQSICRLATVRA